MLHSAKLIYEFESDAHKIEVYEKRGTCLDIVLVTKEGSFLYSLPFSYMDSFTPSPISKLAELVLKLAEAENESGSLK